MVTDEKIVLSTKLVGDIVGEFYIPAYQRGYRWGKEEVEMLLNDMYAAGNKSRDINYCLQPIVVRLREDGKYELIDGQQRLTTIYLIYKYMSMASNGFIIKEPLFSIAYETRVQSAHFLKNMDGSLADTNIDFFFMFQAYQTITEWFADKKKSVMTDLNSYFDQRINVVWYEVGSSQSPIALFERLNIGKIPLTNAELVKALFLSQNGVALEKTKQEEIAFQWDLIERSLHKESFWYFLANRSMNKYETRIDLLLDLLVGKSMRERKKEYDTFFAFFDKSKEKPLGELWIEVQKAFLTLKDWYENHTLYHKIGYLIASNTCELKDIFSSSRDKTKKDFNAWLDERIKESIRIEKNYGDLSYDNAKEANQIKRLLLLFNVETVRQNGEHTQWFPFDKYNKVGDRNAIWSLEHIHAQQSEALTKKEDWLQWISLHINSVKTVAPSQTELIQEMEMKKAEGELDKKEFASIQERVVKLLSATEKDTDYINSIANLALLNIGDNAVLNNSTFDVKRNLIISMDKQGKYIPFCTRMVFFKYYTHSAVNQLHFWGHEDRKAYVENINNVLRAYIEEEITIENTDNHGN